MTDVGPLFSVVRAVNYLKFLSLFGIEIIIIKVQHEMP